jgi:acylglycerol lipase
MHIPLGSPLSGLSHDAGWVAATERDPLFSMTLSARVAIEQVDMNRWILAQAGFPLPLLIMQGTDDRHVAPRVVIEFAKRLTGDITLKVWEGLGHELHNETAKGDVLAYVRAWLDARVRTGT